eukprot:1967876-Ditylum_brightwellii.AAC.1
MQFPAEEDYWLDHRQGVIVYPNFKMWMQRYRFLFTKKHIWLSEYHILAAEKAKDKLWKVRDAIVAVRNHRKRFIPRCCGVALIDEARIPCNGRA